MEKIIGNHLLKYKLLLFMMLNQKKVLLLLFYVGSVECNLLMEMQIYNWIIIIFVQINQYTFYIKLIVLTNLVI